LSLINLKYIEMKTLPKEQIVSINGGFNADFAEGICRTTDFFGDALTWLGVTSFSRAAGLSVASAGIAAGAITGLLLRKGAGCQ
jgi:hypothetical protein